MPATLQGLTDQPNQEYPITLPDGSTATLSLTWCDQQRCWFFDLTWDGQAPAWELLGQTLVTTPNLLRSWRNVLPFGISVATSDGLDPTDQECFTNGDCSLVLLDASDVAHVESTFFPGLP